MLDFGGAKVVVILIPYRLFDLDDNPCLNKLIKNPSEYLQISSLTENNIINNNFFQSLETAEHRMFKEHVVILVISDVRAPSLSLQQLVRYK